MGRAQGRRLAVQAVAAVHAALGADRRRGGDRGGDPRGLRQQQQQHEQGKSSQRRQRRVGHLRREQKLQVHVRQPRHHEHLLRPDAVRDRRRLQAAGLLVSVDRLAEQQRLADGQCPQHRGQCGSRRDRDDADRSDRLQCAGQQGTVGGHPGGGLQRGRALERASRLHRPGPVPLGTGDGHAHRPAGALGRRGDVHRHPRARPTSSRGSTAPWTRSRAIRRSRPTWSRPGRRSRPS